MRVEPSAFITTCNPVSTAMVQEVIAVVVAAGVVSAVVVPPVVVSAVLIATVVVSAAKVSSKKQPARHAFLLATPHMHFGSLVKSEHCPQKSYS